MKRIVLFLLGIILCTAALAGNNDREKTRTKVVTGKITSVAGEELPGASLVVAETGETVFADMQGNFKLTVPAGQNLHITIHNPGFAPKQIESQGLGMFQDFSLDEL